MLNAQVKCTKSGTLIWNARYTDHLPARLQVQTAAQRELNRTDAFTLIGLGHKIQWEVLEFSEEHTVSVI